MPKRQRASVAVDGIGVYEKQNSSFSLVWPQNSAPLLKICVSKRY